VQKWTGQVAQKFNMNQTELIDLFNYLDDMKKRQTVWRAILMYKYNAQKNVGSTPQGRVNGIVIENYPNSTDMWFDILNSLYVDQYRPK
jgi:hypothetical protein